MSVLSVYFLSHSNFEKDNDLVLFSDGFDVLFGGSAASIVDAFARSAKASDEFVLFAAEKNCHPWMIGNDDSAFYYYGSTLSVFFQTALLFSNRRRSIDLLGFLSRIPVSFSLSQLGHVDCSSVAGANGVVVLEVDAAISYF